MGRSKNIFQAEVAQKAAFVIFKGVANSLPEFRRAIRHSKQRYGNICTLFHSLCKIKSSGGLNLLRFQEPGFECF
jgi:hypothetical protein